MALMSDHTQEAGVEGVDEFRGGIEVRGHHVRGLVDARKTVALRKGGSGSKKQYCREKWFLLVVHKALFGDGRA